MLGRGQGERQYEARGSVMAFKALAEQDGGDFSLMERTLPPGGRRPPPHRHTSCSEAYFGLDGLIAVTVAGEDQTLGPEDFLLVPRGTVHTFGNGGEQHWEIVMAASLISTIPMLVIFAFAQRFFIDGVATQGRKG